MTSHQLERPPQSTARPCITDVETIIVRYNNGESRFNVLGLEAFKDDDELLKVRAKIDEKTTIESPSFSAELKDRRTAIVFPLAKSATEHIVDVQPIHESSTARETT